MQLESFHKKTTKKQTVCVYLPLHGIIYVELILFKTCVRRVDLWVKMKKLPLAAPAIWGFGG